MDSGSRESGRAACGQQARISRALRVQISGVMLAVKFLMDNLGRDKVASSRVMDLLRERKT